MTLTPGTRLGAYEIIAAIGAGGMGEVYRARDTKLNRDVALKILPDAFAADHDRLTRFTREAQTLASLNHPNIAQIHGLEDSSSVQALVMEFVEGADLSQRIASGPIPVEDTVAIARQVADAIEAAHEQGIVHRDLKPANVKVRPDGAVKVLDFGLARAFAAEGSSAAADAMNSPTLTAHGTQMGMIIGTAAYMAPEQAKGKAVDKRADVWAFGVVLYEMLTGRRAFGGDDVSETLASVLKDTPSLASLPADTPPSIRRLLRRCLEKDRTRRLDSMAAARLEIDDAIAGEPAATASAASPLAPRRLQVAILIGAIVLAALTGAAVWWLKPAPAQPAANVARYSVTLPANSSWSRTGYHVIAISPDGTHLAYVADSKLFLRKIDRFDATAVSSVRDPREVFFSSDSAWIGFYSEGKLQKVAVTGGAPVPLCQAEPPAGAAHWMGDVVVFGQAKGIYRVAAAGGTPELIVPAETSGEIGSPHLLPGGQTMLYARASSTQSVDDAEIVIEQIATHQKTVLVRGGTDPRVLDGRFLVYGRIGEILAVPIDLKAQKVDGTPMSLVSGVMENSGTGVMQFALSGSGALAYVSGGVNDADQLVWVDLKGGVQPMESATGSYTYPRISPDGTRVAFNETAAGSTDIFIVEWARNNSKIRLTKEPGSEISPVWSPDSKRIVYSAARGSAVANLYWRAADGSGVEERLSTSSNVQVPFWWSKEADAIIFIEQTAVNSNDIYVLPMSGDRTPRPLVSSPFDDRRPALSPDGHWLAYASNERDSLEIHVRPYPDVNRSRVQASAGGGTSPLWSIDGKAIYYRKGNKVFRVNVTTSPEFKAGKPEEMFTFAGPDQTMNFSLAPDGKRFAMVKSSQDAMAQEYRVVINWMEDVKALVKK